MGFLFFRTEALRQYAGGSGCLQVILNVDPKFSIRGKITTIAEVIRLTSVVLGRLHGLMSSKICGVRN